MEEGKEVFTDQARYNLHIAFYQFLLNDSQTANAMQASLRDYMLFSS